MPNDYTIETIGQAAELADTANDLRRLFRFLETAERWALSRGTIPGSELAVLHACVQGFTGDVGPDLEAMEQALSDWEYENEYGRAPKGVTRVFAPAAE